MSGETKVEDFFTAGWRAEVQKQFEVALQSYELGALRDHEPCRFRLGVLLNEVNHDAGNARAVLTNSPYPNSQLYLQWISLGRPLHTLATFPYPVSLSSLEIKNGDDVWMLFAGEINGEQLVVELQATYAGEMTPWELANILGNTTFPPCEDMLAAVGVCAFDIPGRLGVVFPKSRLRNVRQYCQYEKEGIFGKDETLWPDRVYPKGSKGEQMALALRMALQVARGLAHMHRFGVLHRGLQADCAQFDEHRRFRLTDLPLCRLIGASNIISESLPLLMAPESNRGAVYSKRSDIFGFGLLLAAILSHLETEKRDLIPLVRQLPTDQSNETVTAFYESLARRCPGSWGQTQSVNAAESMG